MSNVVTKLLSCLLIFATIVLQGCCGRQANPMPVYMPGDENRSCTSYKAEIAQLEADMTRILPDTNKFGYNAVCAAAGCFLIVPFFFMDMKDAEKVEWEAMRQRRNRLVIYASEQGCDFFESAPKPIPSIEEMQQMSEKNSKKCSKAN